MGHSYGEQVRLEVTYSSVVRASKLVSVWKFAGLIPAGGLEIVFREFSFFTFHSIGWLAGLLNFSKS